ncbi:hypothetical protein [Hahella ganghwensis]|uniref:hypothetical protein n=1 Tax=Hahella ganghwensis TaxID=286420 RepID=UPI00037A6380|nr:hypothetical protein [Hahella ganghwensis]
MIPQKWRQIAGKLEQIGIDQSRAFQCFVTGGITGICGMGTLLLVNNQTQTLSSEIIALLALLISITGIVMAVTGYLSLLLLRLIQTSRKD